MKKVTLKIFTVMFIALLAAIGYSSQNAHAVQDVGSGFTITPPIFDLKANPGDQLEEVVSIYNNASLELDISSIVQNLSPIGEVGQVQVVEEGLPSLKDWVTIKPYNSKVKQGETRNISFSIKVPANAEPGGHFATVVFGNNPQSSESGGSAISSKIGTLVLLTVSGQANEMAGITKFTTDKKNYFDYAPIKFDLSLNNTGNTYIHPRGYIAITNIFGRKVGEIKVEGKNILPGAVRKISSTFQKNRLFGPYTANLSLVYGTTNQNLNASVGFMVIPWMQTAIVLVILIIIILLRKRLWRALLIIVGKRNS